MQLLEMYKRKLLRNTHPQTLKWSFTHMRLDSSTFCLVCWSLDHSYLPFYTAWRYVGKHYTTTPLPPLHLPLHPTLFLTPVIDCELVWEVGGGYNLQ